MNQALYFFDNVGYGSQYLVYSDSLESAVEAIKKYIASTHCKFLFEEDWENAAASNLPKEYELHIYALNEVVQTERS